MIQHSKILAAAVDAGNIELIAGAIAAHEASACLSNCLVSQFAAIAFLGREPEPRDRIAAIAIASAILDAEEAEQ